MHFQDLDNLLEELIAWLEGLENTLNVLEAEPLPDDRATLEMLIADHREFMENTSRRQGEVDRVCKARQIKPIKDTRKIAKVKSPAPVYVFIDIVNLYNNQCQCNQHNASYQSFRFRKVHLVNM